jgi:DNA-binding response OmpR family regulator
MTSPKILVIDDDQTTCNLIETILKMEGFETAAANRVPDGDILALLNRYQANALLMDFHLAAEETLKYIGDIRASKSWQWLPILMTSAINRSQSVLQAGANGFLLKPFDWQQLTKQVKQVVAAGPDQEVLP